MNRDMVSSRSAAEISWLLGFLFVIAAVLPQQLALGTRPSSFAPFYLHNGVQQRLHQQDVKHTLDDGDFPSNSINTDKANAISGDAAKLMEEIDDSPSFAPLWVWPAAEESHEDPGGFAQAAPTSGSGDILVSRRDPAFAVRDRQRAPPRKVTHGSSSVKPHDGEIDETKDSRDPAFAVRDRQRAPPRKVTHGSSSVKPHDGEIDETKDSRYRVDDDTQIEDGTDDRDSKIFDGASSNSPENYATLVKKLKLFLAIFSRVLSSVDVDEAVDNDRNNIAAQSESRIFRRADRRTHTNNRSLHYMLKASAYRKRSHECMRKCLRQKLLHPAQCHTLC
ncbi:unnamed protein product [Notodromas monacha]|uniref:Uncharacterized protein n=1 Tax=Notodromas monacha TaxID=399045 RepID=A0A7R9GCJ8_9CRUS|nr:unnamed protein product [Notodromas monacha]CAG0916184.1 unnamed protein product [Notodromas monacha]